MKIEDLKTEKIIKLFGLQKVAILWKYITTIC